MPKKPKEINFKNYFCTNLKDREVDKNRFCAKIHAHKIRIYYSNQFTGGVDGDIRMSNPSVMNYYNITHTSDYM